MDRRSFLRNSAALATAPYALLRARPAPLAISGIHHATLTVSDVGRSLAFYQRLFGMPVQARTDGSVLLRLGEGPRYLELTGATGGASPSISGFGLEVDDLRIEAVEGALAGRARVERRAATLVVTDPDRLTVQLVDPGWCGDADCGDPEPPPAPGPLPLRDISHLTITVSDPPRSSAFYRDVFGLDVQAMQAQAPALGVGPGVHFLMFIGGDVPRIHHVCFGVDGFDLEGIQRALELHGIRPREAGSGTTGPLRHWVSMRMPNRGGAPGGTPELYFSDPDGLAIQLQDVRYCGGGGYLGDEC